MGWGRGWVRAAGDGARGLNNVNRGRGEEGDSGRARGRTRGGPGGGSGPGFKLFKLFNSVPGPPTRALPGPPPANI